MTPEKHMRLVRTLRQPTSSWNRLASAVHKTHNCLLFCEIPFTIEYIVRRNVADTHMSNTDATVYREGSCQVLIKAVEPWAINFVHQFSNTNNI